MKQITVFYAGLIYNQFDSDKYSWAAISKILSAESEIYNGAYLHHNGDWYRPDLTPVLLDDVPKELRTWVLLLGG